MRDIDWVVMIVFAGALLQPALANKGKGRQVRYVGIHPVPKAAGGGVCYIEGPHVHIFAANKLEYRDHGRDHYFVGDPVAYGFDGPRHAYQGHHPIHVDVVVGDDVEDVEFCYLDGPHFHAFSPPPGPEFEVAGDANFYVGDPPPVYLEARPAMVKINAVYAPLAYARPVVTVEPPSAWIGVRAGFAVPAAVIVDDRPAAVVVPGRAEAGVGIDVVIPTPSLSIDIGFGVSGGHRHKPKHKHKKWKRRH